MLIKLTAAVGALLTVLGGVSTYIADTRPYQVTGHFLGAEGVVPGNDVLSSGAKVGSVSAVALAPDSDPNGGALVTMTIDRRYTPLHEGSKAEIRQKGFLGNMYVELTPGPDGNRAIRNGGSIPIQDTAAPVDLDQVMDIFDRQTREKIKIATQQGGAMFNGNGENLNHILADLPQVTENLASVARNIDLAQEQLDSLTVEFDRVAQMMAAEDQALRGDIRNGASLLQSMAAREARLQQEITEANRALGALNGALQGHEKDLATVLQAMPALQDRLKQLSQNSDPVLADINMCYGDIINAVGELRSSTAYKHPAGSQDANGFELRVYTTFAQTNGVQGQTSPPTATCQGGTPSG